MVEGEDNVSEVTGDDVATGATVQNSTEQRKAYDWSIWFGRDEQRFRYVMLSRR